MSISVLTVGMAVVDYVADADAADLSPDMVHPGSVRYLDAPLERLVGERYAGGHPVNVAIDLAKLGAPPFSVGAIASVGRDADGAFLANILASFNVRPLLRVQDTKTGHDQIARVRGEDRSFNIYPGANLALTAGDVMRTIEFLRPAILSIRPGYSGIDRRAADVLHCARDVGASVVLDIMRPMGEQWCRVRRAVPFANAVHGNVAELCALTGTRTASAAIAELLDAGVELVLCTDGEKGATVASELCMVTQPAFRVDAVDPSGCGDAFCAGAIEVLLTVPSGNWSMHSDVDLAGLALSAQAVGAACAEAVGCTAGVSSERVEELISEQMDDLLERSEILRSP